NVSSDGLNMVPNRYSQCGMVPPARWRRLTLGLLLVCLGAPRLAAEELPPQPVPISGFASCLPPTPQQPPRPATGKEAIVEFVDNLSSTDTVIEVIVGQGRILTLKESLDKDVNKVPSIAIGDPSVVEITLVSQDPGPQRRNFRQLRVV